MRVNLHTLHLTLEQLAEVRDTLHRNILQGLGAHNQEIKALPAYLHRPSRTLAGDAVALDVGGTNIRAAQVRLQAEVAEVHGAPGGEHCSELSMGRGRRDVAGTFPAERGDHEGEPGGAGPLDLGRVRPHGRVQA